MSEMHCKHTLLGCLLVGTVVKASLNMQVPDKCENVSAIVIATLNDATDVLLYLKTLLHKRELLQHARSVHVQGEGSELGRDVLQGYCNYLHAIICMRTMKTG